MHKLILSLSLILLHSNTFAGGSSSKVVNQLEQQLYEIADISRESGRNPLTKLIEQNKWVEFRNFVLDSKFLIIKKELRKDAFFYACSNKKIDFVKLFLESNTFSLGDYLKDTGKSEKYYNQAIEKTLANLLEILRTSRPAPHEKKYSKYIKHVKVVSKKRNENIGKPKEPLIFSELGAGKHIP